MSAETRAKISLLREAQGKLNTTKEEDRRIYDEITEHIHELQAELPVGGTPVAMRIAAENLRRSRDRHRQGARYALKDRATRRTTDPCTGRTTAINGRQRVNLLRCGSLRRHHPG